MNTSERQTAPRIVTLAFEPTVQARLDALREQFFPSRAYRLPAHLTLLHAVPPSHAQALGQRAQQLCRRLGPFTAALGPVRPLGRGGFAVRVQAAQIGQLRRGLQAALPGVLSRQDQGGLRPHVTLANKLSPSQAQLGMLAAASAWSARDAAITSLHIWLYLDGPWRLERTWPLRPAGSGC